MGDTWHDACMPCGGVQPIKRGSMEEKRWRNKRKGERKKERKEDPVDSSSDFRRSNGRSSSGRELKSFYSMRATLQEVRIFLLLFIAFLFGQVFKGTGWGLSLWTEVQDCSVAMWGRMCGLSMACLWPGISLGLNSLGDGSGTVLCLGCGMFVWSVMTICVDCFYRHLFYHNWS